MELQLPAKEGSIYISETDDTVQTPLRYTYIYLFTNPTKPLRNSSTGFEVTFGCGHCSHPPSFLPSLTKLAETAKCCLRTLSQDKGCERLLNSLFLIHFLNMQDYPCSASLYLPHSPSEMTVNPNAEQCCSRECYPSGRKEGMCDLFLVPSPSSCRIRKPMQIPERARRRKV